MLIIDLKFVGVFVKIFFSSGLSLLFLRYSLRFCHNTFQEKGFTLISVERSQSFFFFVSSEEVSF